MMYGHCGLFRKTLVTSSLAKVAKKIGNILRCFKNNTLKSKTAVTTIWATFYSNILSHFICCDHMDHIVCVSKNCCDHYLGNFCKNGLLFIPTPCHTVHVLIIVS